MEMFKYSAEIGGNAHIAHISLSISDQVLIFLVLPNIRPKFARFATVFTSVPQKLPLPLISEEADIERGDSVLRALLKECIWNLSIQIRGVPRDHSKLETECWTALKRYSLQPPLYTTKLRATKIRRSLFNVSEKYTKNIVKLFPVICTPLICSTFTSLSVLYFFVVPWMRVSDLVFCFCRLFECNDLLWCTWIPQFRSLLRRQGIVSTSSDRWITCRSLAPLLCSHCIRSDVLTSVFTLIDLLLWTLFNKT